MQNRDPRAYYNDQNGQFPTGQPYDSSNYPSASSYASYDYPHHPPQYYASAGQAHSVSPSHPYYRSMTPGPQSNRHSNSSSSREYCPPSGIVHSSSSLQQPYTNQEYYQNQYTGSGVESRSPTQTQFIPTPTDMAHSYSNYTQPIPSQSPTMSTHYGQGVNQYHGPVQMVTQTQHPPRPSRISTGRPRTASGATTSPVLATSPPGERFPCEKCGKTFSRSHDRKRHHETQHLPTPVIHRCRYCEKEFSRADSLKRHLDNGCDEMPQ